MTSWHTSKNERMKYKSKYEREKLLRAEKEKHETSRCGNEGCDEILGEEKDCESGMCAGEEEDEREDVCDEDCENVQAQKEVTQSEKKGKCDKKKQERKEKEKMRRNIEKLQLAKATRCGLNFTGRLSLLFIASSHAFACYYFVQ